MQDQEILAGLRQRDEQTISLIMAKYSRLMWPIASVVLKNVGSDQDVEECIADVFVELWQEPCRFDPQRGNLKSWLCMRARCRAVDCYRVLSKHSTIPLDSAMMVSRMGLQEKLLREESRQELITAVNALSDVERDILVRRYYYEQKPRQIATALDMSVKQVDNSLYRSKQKLREKILSR